jgi:phosphoglucosamine mutase
MIGMHRRRQQKLNPSTIVGTVMTNSGIENYLREAGICLHRSAVGDRYVLEDMLKLKATIGGEQSGHLIFLDKSPTGDGLISLLETLQSAVATEFKLLDDSENIPLYSQVLLNVPVIDRDKVLQSLTFSNELEKIRKSHPDVRIVVRPSGTEPLFRILAEALDPSLSQHLARQLADIAASIS